MDDIEYFSDEKVKKVKKKPLYYTDSEIVIYLKQNKKLIKGVFALLLISIASFSGYLYYQEKQFSQQVNETSTSLTQRISELANKIEDIYARILGIEGKSAEMEERIGENEALLEETNKRIGEVEENIDEKISNLEITAKEAENVALLYAQGITGMKAKGYLTDDGKWVIESYEVDNFYGAKKISQEVLEVRERKLGFEVDILIGFKGFNFTNGILYWKFTFYVNEKGVVTDYTYVFDH